MICPLCKTGLIRSEFRSGVVLYDCIKCSFSLSKPNGDNNDNNTAMADQKQTN